MGSERLTGATLDRLTHRCRIIETKGERYRFRDAKARTRSATRGNVSSGVRDGAPNQPTGTVDQAPATK